MTRPETLQAGARGDRAVAIGALIAFLVTGFFGEDPAERRAPGDPPHVQRPVRTPDLHR
jgi:hypothetical protein